MTDFIDTRSGRWQALQRTLAEGIARCPVGAATVDVRTARKRLRAPGATAPPRSWLREAHARARAAPVGAK